MKNRFRKITLIIIAIFLISFIAFGFYMANQLDGPISSSTMMACPCQVSEEPYEQQCNLMTKSDIYFFTIILNVGNRCEGYQIIQCPAINESENLYDEYGQIRIESEGAYFKGDCAITLSTFASSIKLGKTKPYQTINN